MSEDKLMGFPMGDGFCQQCGARVLLVRTEKEAEIIRAAGIVAEMGAAAVFACTGEMASCPTCGHKTRLPKAGEYFGPQHPVCPNCGNEFTEYDLAQCEEGALCLGDPEMIDGELCLIVITEIRCDCGHVLDFDPTGDDHAYRNVN